MEASVIRVVVVDDHALHRDGTRQLLDAYPDLQIIGEANSGELALELITQLHPDVVSAYDENEYVCGALEAGAAGYLSKTAPGKELVEAVRAWLVGQACSGQVWQLSF
jgi:DNA-binding NarL/FixJ family response regulator